MTEGEKTMTVNKYMILYKLIGIRKMSEGDNYTSDANLMTQTNTRMISTYMFKEKYIIQKPESGCIQRDCVRYLTAYELEILKRGHPPHSFPLNVPPLYPRPSTHTPFPPAPSRSHHAIE